MFKILGNNVTSSFPTFGGTYLIQVVTTAHLYFNFFGRSIKVPKWICPGSDISWTITKIEAKEITVERSENVPSKSDN